MTVSGASASSPVRKRRRCRCPGVRACAVRRRRTTAPGQECLVRRTARQPRPSLYADVPRPGQILAGGTGKFRRYPFPGLRAATETATVRRLASRYTHLAATIPGLINELTRAAHGYTGHDQQSAFALLTIAYRAADAIADKFGYTDLSARIIELLRWAASHSGNPALIGVGAYVRAETFFDQHPTAGLRALDAASASLNLGGSRDELAIYGSLHMRAAVVAACAGLNDAMRSHLVEARDVARHVRDGV